LNKDWKELKTSSSGVPTWDSFIPYILEVLRNEEETTRGVIVERVLIFCEFLKNSGFKNIQKVRILNLFYIIE